MNKESEVLKIKIGEFFFIEVHNPSLNTIIIVIICLVVFLIFIVLIRKKGVLGKFMDMISSNPP